MRLVTQLWAKASAGGEGRGMRLIKEEKDFDAQYLAASSEALAAFGDGTMYLEEIYKQS